MHDATHYLCADQQRHQIPRLTEVPGPGDAAALVHALPSLQIFKQLTGGPHQKKRLATALLQAHSESPVVWICLDTFGVSILLVVTFVCSCFFFPVQRLHGFRQIVTRSISAKRLISKSSYPAVWSHKRELVMDLYTVQYTFVCSGYTFWCGVHTSFFGCG